MAWEIAGLSRVCKTLREGFDSLPRLHIWIEPKNDMPYRKEGKRFPIDYRKRELVELVLFHHSKNQEYKTENVRIKQRMIEMSKELSQIKREK